MLCGRWGSTYVLFEFSIVEELEPQKMQKTLRRAMACLSLNNEYPLHDFLKNLDGLIPGP